MITLPQSDYTLFSSLQGKYSSEREAEFFKIMQEKETGRPCVNDLLVSEDENPDRIYLVRLENSDYLVGHIFEDGTERNIQATSLSEALEIDLCMYEFIERKMTLWQWLRECDYGVVRYDRMK